ENWRRGGTENVAAIVAFASAAEEALLELASAERIQTMKTLLETGLKSVCPDTLIFGEGAERLVNTTCFAVRDIPAETALIALDLERVSVSSGSACSSGKVSVSHVLTAMGVDEVLARCAIRISTGWDTRPEEIDAFLELWPTVVDRLNPEARSRAA
ncbi:MAG: aminotransferase class V-fold PLP-dependent enzyme, partial [Pseudomonadota bacterium]